MFAKSQIAGIQTIKLICGLGLCTLGGAMLYVYFTKPDDDENENSNDTNQNGQIGGKEQKKSASQKPKMTTVKMTIDNKHIPLLLGRSGENLRLLEERTKTKIEFRDKNDTQKYCQITGVEENVKEASEYVTHEIERVPVIKEIIKVPQFCMTKIIGLCGEVLTDISRQSNAKITINPDEPQKKQKVSADNEEYRYIQIEGNAQQVKVARKLIEDKIAEEEKLRRMLELAEQNREPRRSPTNSMTSSLYSSQTSLNSHVPLREKMLASNEKPMEVYVSAVASPAKFWVQIIGKQIPKLNDLVDEMTAYYGVERNRELHKIDVSQLYVGQIVATIFKYDSKWYRAEIVNILPNIENPNDVEIDLYFVDYGDSDYVKPEEIFELRTDFLTLRFQAVECFLANIKPMLNTDTEYWERPAIAIFEELTQVARWKKFNLRVVTYAERPKNDYSSELISVPGVELYDIVDQTEVNLAQCLMTNGYGFPREEDRGLHQRSTSRELASSSGSVTPTLSPQSQHQTKTTPSNATSVEDAKLMENMDFLQKNRSNGPVYSNITDIINLDGW